MAPKLIGKPQTTLKALEHSQHVQRINKEIVEAKMQ
jgi:hypothetical protein